MQIEPIDLAVELRQIANEMDRAGSSPVQEFCGSRYDSDILRDAAAEIERLRSLVDPSPAPPSAGQGQASMAKEE